MAARPRRDARPSVPLGGGGSPRYRRPDRHIPLSCGRGSSSRHHGEHPPSGGSHEHAGFAHSLQTATVTGQRLPPGTGPGHRSPSLGRAWGTTAGPHPRVSPGQGECVRVVCNAGATGDRVASRLLFRPGGSCPPSHRGGGASPGTRRVQCRPSDAWASRRQARPLPTVAGQATRKRADRWSRCPGSTERLEGVRAKVLALREAIEEEAGRQSARIDAALPKHRLSAANLAHYLGLRKQDVRPLQLELAALGLSSLGRSEGHVRDTLLRLGAWLSGRECQATSTADPLDWARAAALLHENTRALFGPPPAGRRVYIMVTAPDAADVTPAWADEVVQGGSRSPPHQRRARGTAGVGGDRVDVQGTRGGARRGRPRDRRSPRAQAAGRDPSARGRGAAPAASQGPAWEERGADPGAAGGRLSAR
jgi:hypothetical protein